MAALIYRRRIIPPAYKRPASHKIRDIYRKIGRHMTGYLPSYYMLCIYDLEIKRWHIMHISIFIVNILSKRIARKPDSGFLLNQLKNDWLLSVSKGTCN